MHPWALLAPKLVTWFGAFFAGVSLALIPVVILRRKEPSSTIAWILALLFLPVVGAVLFVLFGRDRVRWPAKRKRQADALVRTSVVALTGEALLDLSARQGEMSELERQIFRVGSLLTFSSASASNKVYVLTKGDDVYEALGAAIDAAKHHIHAEFYLIRNDATGAWFRDKLARAAERGVEVRLLCDAYGCLALGPPWRRPLRRAGGRVGIFLPMRSLLLQPVNLRNHRKIVVVDGRVAFSGGVNIGDEYRGRMRGIGQWRDTHLRMEGPAASALQRVFLQDWFFATGEGLNLSNAAYFPPEEAGRARAGDATVAIVPSGPDTRTEAIHRLFFAAIAGARERVWITTPYFVPDAPMVVALQVAAMRGVDVKLILPSRSNHRVTFHAGRSFYEELLDAGVEIREYTPGMIHAKTMVVDGRIVLVGSANMDMRSFRLNFEVHALIHDAHTAQVLEACFEADLAETSLVTKAAWAARPLGWRIAEGAGRFVSPLL
ncbi:MAG TPA: cardiolipin synthase [Polyangiaceae bacterium]|nr:cardiolipin synthase [Polyangiaceae bacterium]